MDFSIILCLVALLFLVVIFLRKDVVSILKGKKIAVLGARATGKTTLLNYISFGILLERYKQTIIPEEINLRLSKLSDELDIHLKKTTDVGGGKDDYPEWKKLFIDSNLVLYLVRADKLFQQDEKTKERVIEDAHQFYQWVKEIRSRKKNYYKLEKISKQFFIIGTHCDRDPNFLQLRDDNAGNYKEQFGNLEAVSEMIQALGGKRKVKVVLGSFENTDNADKLIKQIFRQVKK